MKNHTSHEEHQNNHKVDNYENKDTEMKQEVINIYKRTDNCKIIKGRELLMQTKS